MRKYRCGPSFLLLVGALALHSVSNLNAQDVRTVTVDSVGVPGGLQGLFESADVVIQGRIVGSRQTALRDPHVVDVVPIVEHRVKVEEIFKGDLGRLEGLSLTVEQAAGEAQGGARVFRVSNWNAFHPGEVYVLFLKKFADRDAYSLVSSQGGAYQLASGRATTQGKSLLKSDNQEEFISTLRSLRGR